MGERKVSREDLQDLLEVWEGREGSPQQVVLHRAGGETGGADWKERERLRAVVSRLLLWLGGLWVPRESPHFLSGNSLQEALNFNNLSIFFLSGTFLVYVKLWVTKPKDLKFPPVSS